jgi:hypothetical protein
VKLFSKLSQDLLEDLCILEINILRARTLQERKHLDSLRNELKRRVGEGESEYGQIYD